MSSVSVYAKFTTQCSVDAQNLGWPKVADVGGTSTQSLPYTSQTYQDVANTMYNNLSLWWLSYWGVSWPAKGDNFSNGGNQAGYYVGNMDSGMFIIPQYFILDPEGYNTAASTASEWSDFLNGWVSGLGAWGLQSQAALYYNQSQYTTYSLGTVGLPAFMALSPNINNTSCVTGGNVQGYAGYYASSSATDYANQIVEGTYSTVQFSDSSVN